MIGMSKPFVFSLVAVAAFAAACTPTNPIARTAPELQPVDQLAVAPLAAASLSDTPLGQALSASLINGPTAVAARAAESVARAGVATEAAGRRPALNLGVTAGGSTASDDTTFTPGIRLTQLLYDGGATSLRVEAAEAGVRASQAETVTRLTERTLSAVAAWEEVYLSRRLVEIARRSLAHHDDIAARVDLRVSSGAAGSAETLRVASRRADAAALLARAQGQRAEAEARAMEIFGRSISASPVPQAPAVSTPSASNPTLLALAARRDAARSTLEARRAERNPGLFFDLTGTVDGDGGDVGGGLRLDYPIDTSGRRGAAIEAAEANLAQANAEYDLAESELQRLASSAAQRQRTLSAEARAARTAVDAARTALENAEAGFSGGRTSILNLLDLTREANQAARNQAEVVSALRVAGYERLAVSGDLLAIFGIDPRQHAGR